MTKRLGTGVVVGASAGIGLAIIEKLAARADRVVGVSRRGGDRPDDVVADIRSYASIDSAIARITELGPMDFVVSCVGVGYYAPIGADYSPQWSDTLETNVVGLLNLLSVLHERIPALGHFVHIGSLAARRVSSTPGSLVYSVSKTAAQIITEQFRVLLRADGRPTKVTTVSPGFVVGTEWADRYFAHAEAERVALFAGHDSLEPGDVADVVAQILMTGGDPEITEVVVRPRWQAT